MEKLNTFVAELVIAKYKYSNIPRNKITMKLNTILYIAHFRNEA